VSRGFRPNPGAFVRCPLHDLAILQANALDALRLLIRTPSVNPSLAPEEGCTESAIAAAACQWLASRGVRSWTEDAAPGRPNAVAEAGGSSGRTLIFCAHLDTVGTAGMTIPPFEPRVEGARVYGRGSYDMKGSAAAVMAAMAALASSPSGGRVVAALVADEEHASLGAQDFVRRHTADACLLTEPSEGRLVLAHKGFVWVEIATRGRAAHGSRWDLGVSAIARAGRIIAALEEFDRVDLRCRTHPLLGPASQHCSMISGGSGLSTYAEKCVLQVERRTLPGETSAAVLREIERVIEAAGEQAEVRVLLERPPLVCDPDAEIAGVVRQAATAVTGSAPEEIGVGYWMDAALFAAAGIPTVNYGPAGGGAHEAVEWVDLDSVTACAQVLIETARRFLGR
jgi:acetylornithine deacetylase